jgi:hypothetical protein
MTSALAEGHMSAIEYGSYYWCVILNERSNNQRQESIHLHADDLAIDTNGTLTFRSAGRRPAGAEPQRKDGKQEEQEKGDGNKDPKAGKDGENGKENHMIYMAFAPGSWKIVYAAKLQDGSSASVEHWNVEGRQEPLTVTPANSGATGLPPRQ